MLKSYFKHLQIEEDYLLVDQASFSTRAELKELHHHYNHGFLSRQDPDEFESPGIETLLSK